MLDVISKKNSFFVIVNDRIFRYSLFGDNETHELPQIVRTAQKRVSR